MTLYDEVVTVAKDYMGPTAEWFMSRQLNGHLNIEPHQLTRNDLEDPVMWCYTSAKLIMREERAREFSSRIEALRS